MFGGTVVAPPKFTAPSELRFAATGPIPDTATGPVPVIVLPANNNAKFLPPVIAWLIIALLKFPAV